MYPSALVAMWTMTLRRVALLLVTEIRQPHLYHIRQSLQLVEHAVGQRLIDVDRGQRIARSVGARLRRATRLVITRDVDAGAAERRAHTSDHAGHVAVLDHEHPAVRHDVDVEIVDANHAPVAVTDQRAGYAHSTARGVDLHTDRRLKPGLRCAGLGAELNALLLGQHLRVDQADRAGVHGG